MTRFKLIFISISIILFSTACENEIELEVDFLEESMVMNAVFFPNHYPYVKFHKTINPLDFDYGYFHQLDNVEARVIDENGNIINLYPLKNEFNQEENEIFFYTDTTFIVEAGKKYSLEAYHPAYGALSTEGRVPEFPDPASIDITYLNLVKNTGSDEFIIDNPETPNFLNLTFHKTSESQEYVLISATHTIDAYEEYEDDIYQSVGFSSSIFLNARLHSQYGNGIFIDLRNYPLGELQFQIEASVLRNMMSPEERAYYANVEEYVAVNFSFASTDTFNYLYSKLNNSIDDPFQEPSPVYNNIEGGYGIMVCYNELNIRGEIKN